MLMLVSCVACGGSLLGTNSAKGAEVFRIDGPCVVEERADNTLDPLDAGFGKGWACVNVGGFVLGFGTVDDASVPVWRMLW